MNAELGKPFHCLGKYGHIAERANNCSSKIYPIALALGYTVVNHGWEDRYTQELARLPIHNAHCPSVTANEYYSVGGITTYHPPYLSERNTDIGFKQYAESADMMLFVLDRLIKEE